MYRSVVLAVTAAAAMAGAASSAQAATILSLDAASLCGKGGCFTNGTTFQKTLSGPVSISALSIDKTMLGDLSNYAVKISFTTRDGTVVGSWGAYTLAVFGSDIVTVGGQTIDWDGAAGDLVLNLEVLVPKKGGGFGGGGGFAGAPGLDTEFGRGASGGIVVGGAPLPPGLGNPLPVELPPAGRGPFATAVPEPGAWALMLTGFLGAGTALRNRRRHLRCS